MTQPAGPYQMPPSTPSPSEGRPASSAGYWIGGGILLLGCGAAIVWFVVLIVGLVNAPEEYERMSVPGSTVLTLDDGDWMIYQEYPGANTGTYVEPPAIDVTGPSGRPVSLRIVSSNLTYSTGSYDGVAIYEFTAPTAGAYTIEASTVGEPTRFSTQGLAVGRPLFDFSNVGGILGSIALGAVSFIVGLVILIVTIVRRSRARRRVRPAMAPYGSPGPFGAPPPYGAPGYGAPPPHGAPGAYPPAPGPGPQPPGPPPATPPAPAQPPAAPSPWTPPGTPPGEDGAGRDDRPPA